MISATGFNKSISTINFGADKKDASQYKFVNVCNPFTKRDCNNLITIDLSKPKRFELRDMFPLDEVCNTLAVDYNPDFNGELFDKVTHESIPVNILTCSNAEKKGHVVYEFMSKDLKQNYGYVWFSTPQRTEKLDRELAKDHPEAGIVGDRLIVEYLRNINPQRFGGVGKLADKLEVKYCLDNNIEPNIVSYADYGSHLAHYKRGKRFFVPDRYTYDYCNMMVKYNNPDPNAVLEDYIVANKDEGIDSGFNLLPMYLPKSLIDKYSEEYRNK